MIDVHHHVAPATWLANGLSADQDRAFKGWSIAKALEEMDRSGVTTAYASITALGDRFDTPDGARRVSREFNDYMAALRADHPGRFGIFATLPMPDVEATLAEIAYAYDTLNVDGVGLFTSYGEKYVGNGSFDPVFAELDRRNAVAFVHPTSAPCSDALQPWLPAAAIEFGTDTTRAIAEYVFSGSSQRFPGVRMICSHAGGTMPFLVQRFINAGNGAQKAKTPNGFLPEANKFFYDTAQVASRGAMQALRAIVPASQILYGTDYPFRTFDWTAELLAQGAVFDAHEMRGILHDNAAALVRPATRPD
jgi:predicted TIM-barrel fold metal-dependent hydrolase